MTTYIFGRRWDSPQADDAEMVPTPIGQRCPYCDEPIVDGECGVLLPRFDSEGKAGVAPVHMECDLRSFLSHLLKTCACHGDGVEYPSVRAEALATLDAENARRAAHGLGPM